MRHDSDWTNQSCQMSYSQSLRVYGGLIEAIPVCIPTFEPSGK